MERFKSVDEIINFMYTQKLEIDSFTNSTPEIEMRISHPTSGQSVKGITNNSVYDLKRELLVKLYEKIN